MKPEQKRNIRILIVDDTSVNIQVVASILKPEGYILSFARNGVSALKIVERKQIDLVLLDIMMPGMDGYEVCQKLKANDQTKDIPVIFLTAKTDPDSIIKGFEMGVVDYVTKPFNGSELLARVNTHLKLKITQQNLEKKNIELKELNATKDKLFSIIGHDLRGPIGSFRTMLELIITKVQDYNDQSLIMFLNLGVRSTESTLVLLENLLSWAKSQRGELGYKPLKGNLDEVIKETVHLLSGQAHEKHIKIKTTIDENIKIVFDHDMVKTIIRNLGSNAIKFTPENGNISITAKLMDDHVEIMVKDSGIGIEKENLNKIFNDKVHYTTYGTKNEKGTGLGLMLCKDFVEKHGGRIRVKSEVGKGSAFIFTLPVSKA